MKLPYFHSSSQHFLLIIVFIFLFAASAVFIVLERSVRREVAANTGETGQSNNSVVAGEEVIRDQAIVAYQKFARETLSRLAAAPTAEELKELQDDILNERVPAPYQELHWKLLQLVRRLATDSDVDTDWFSEQVRILGEDYPWLL